MTYINPTDTVHLTPNMPEEYQEVRFDRRLLSHYLIEKARADGVKIFFEAEVTHFITGDERVTGIEVGNERVHADLVIDSAGMTLDCRNQLKPLGLNFDYQVFDIMHVFRGTFQYRDHQKVDESYRVYFYPLPKPSIAWVVQLDDEIDILIGSVGELTKTDVEETLKMLREKNSNLSSVPKRKGLFTTLSLRSPIDDFSAHGYVVIGDGAGMLIPLSGSGIDNSIYSGMTLGKLINENNSADISVLKQFQVQYMKNRGSFHASLAPIKNFLFSLKPSELDYLFERKIITENDLLLSASGRSLTLSLRSKMQRGWRGKGKLGLLLKMYKIVRDSKKLGK
jgi:flavin-dependent dehydrogenase